MGPCPPCYIRVRAILRVCYIRDTPLYPQLVDPGLESDNLAQVEFVSPLISGLGFRGWGSVVETSPTLLKYTRQLVSFISEEFFFPIFITHKPRLGPEIEAHNLAEVEFEANLGRV